MLYNFPFKIKVGGKTLFPTVAKLPDWASNPMYRNAVVIPDEAKVRVVGKFSVENLGESVVFPDAPRTLDWSTVNAWIKEVAPTTERQIVEWMQTAATANVFCHRLMDEYSRAGSSVIAKSDDSYSPGLSVEDLKFRPELGSTVTSRGYGIVDTPSGSFNVRCPGAATGVFKNILSWAAILEAFLKQWVGVLVKFRELAQNPQDRISFPSFKGLTMPLFFTHSSSIPTPVNLVEFSISSNKPQKVIIKGRSTDDYTDVLFEDKVDVSEGQNVIQYPLYGFPVVPTMVIELQPENNTQTVLDYWEVYP